MKRLCILLCTLFVAIGCSNEEDILPKQQEQIVAFLKGSHSPRLISEQELKESLEPKPAYFTAAGNTAYRYISTQYNPDRETRTPVVVGSKLSITFRAYLFNNKMPSTLDIYYTNDELMKEELIKAGLTLGFWPFGQPFEITLGQTDIIKGLEVSLEGCREGDHVELYMTYKMAYGKDFMYNLPKESPVVWLFTIDKVEK
ncbi:MAG: FKBP-type peptidyl-prolyl cis-trans isomerase [Alistipes sp.]